MDATTYTPVTFTLKDGSTEVAETIGEYYQLLWDGASPNGPAPARPPFSPEQQAELSATIVDRAMRQPFSGVQQPPARPVVVSYLPSTAHTPATSGTAWVALDSTNLKATFVCPPSGKLKVTLNALAQINIATTSNASQRWALYEGGALITDSQIQTATSTTSVAISPPRPVQGVATISKDGAGNPLVPGKTYTVTWMQRMTVADTQGTTQYGLGLGPATMTLEPVSDRLTEVVATPTITQPSYLPLWLCHDRETILGHSVANTAKLAWSTDDTGTWTEHAHTFTGGVQQVRELDNGEVVVFAGWGGTTADPIAAWVSTGWATDKATATFTRTLQAQGPDASTDGGSWGSWGVDTYGEVVLACEYGPKVSPANMARYVYMSEDYGQTWRTIYDHADPSSSTGVGAHLHGICYDPWWDAIWLVVGDGAGNEGTHVSFDRGRTWRNLNQEQQFTSVYALPEAIVFVTDEGAPNGIYRIPRTHPDNLVWELVLEQDPDVNLSIIGTQMFRSRSLAGAPLLMSCDTGNKPGPGRLFATYDGYTIREVWSDAGQSYANFGLRNMVGPTLTGKYHGKIRRTQTDFRQVTLTI